MAQSSLESLIGRIFPYLLIAGILLTFLVYLAIGVWGGNRAVRWIDQAGRARLG